MKAYSEERKIIIADKFNAGMSLGDIKKISAKLENPKILSQNTCISSRTIFKFSVFFRFLSENIYCY